MIARTAASAVLGRMRGGRIEIVEPDGRSHEFGPPDADLATTLRVHGPAFWRALTRGSRALAKLYGEGGWDADDIVTAVARDARGGDLIVIMSNGGFDDIHRKLLSSLERQS